MAPTSLYTVYQTYKKGTTELISFLLSHGTKDGGASPPIRIPVRRILELAKELAAKSVTPPKHIREAFRVVLVNRRKLTNHYELKQEASQKATVEATSRHKFFNETLAQAYDVLFSSLPPTTRKAAKKAKAAARITGAIDAGSEGASTNRFEVLSDMIVQEPAFEEIVLSNVEDEQCSIAQLSPIEDDPIEAAIALHTYLTEVEGVISACKTCWRSSARGDIPLALAGWITMLAQEIIRHVAEPQDAKLGGYADFAGQYATVTATVMEKHRAKNTPFQFHLGLADGVYEFHDLTLGTGLMWPLTALRRFWGEGKVSDVEYMSVIEEKPLVEYFGTRQEETQAQRNFVQQVKACIDPENGVPGDEKTFQATSNLTNLYHGRDMAIVDALIRNLLRVNLVEQDLLQRGHAAPLSTEMWRFFNGPTEPIPSSLVFGIHLLTETSKSYLWAHPSPPNLDNLRGRAVEFAEQVADAVEALLSLVLSDGAFDGLFTHHIFQDMDNLMCILDNLKANPRLDLYHQSPWVAGSHMSAILAIAQDFGLGLLNESGIFGSLLCLYNMIHQVGVPCPKIPTLEYLCDSFTSQVFLGKTRPTTRFSPMLQVYLGAGLVHRRDGPSILVPEVHSKGRDMAFSKNARIKAEDMCMFTHQMNDDGLCGDTLWNKIADELVKTNDGKKKIRRGPGLKDRLLQQFALPDVLLTAFEVMAEDFDGDLPIACLNSFKLLTLCLRTWKRITEKYEEGGNVPMHLEGMAQHWGVGGSIAIGMALHGFTAEDVDAKMKMGGMQKRALKEHGALLLMKDAVVEIWEEAYVKDLLWRGI